MSKEVHFVARVLTHYRVPFHELVRDRLGERGIRYRLFYSKGTVEEERKNDTSRLDWATEVPVTYFRGKQCYQHAFASTKNADLIVIGQENSLFLNYVFQLRRLVQKEPKIAFFGHGKNFQSRNPDGAAESFKKFWLKKVDWWFAYTEGTKRYIIEQGFDPRCITVFNNSIDTSQARKYVSNISPRDIDEYRYRNFAGSNNICIYIGGLYPDKNLDFLIESADLIRKEIEDFHLIVAGDGVLKEKIYEYAENRNWLHVVGPKFGQEKALLASVSSLILMPGLVGLAIIDSFVYERPLITTTFPYHSPEFDYLENGVNGVVTPYCGGPVAFSKEVAGVLTDRDKQELLRRGCRVSLERFSIESMADRFVEGVEMCIGS